MKHQFDYMTKEEIQEIARKVEESNNLAFVMDIRRWCYRKVNKLDSTSIKLSAENARYLFKVCDTKLHLCFGVDDCVKHCKLNNDEWFELKKSFDNTNNI